MTAPVFFADGHPAPYGFGLARSIEFGHAATGHGGALRGWRSHRLTIRGERLSVVVLFNRMAGARQAALDLLGAALGHAGPVAGSQAATSSTEAPPAAAALGVAALGVAPVAAASLAAAPVAVAAAAAAPVAARSPAAGPLANPKLPVPDWLVSRPRDGARGPDQGETGG